jgi:two-component sensor histidine kinase
VTEAVVHRRNNRHPASSGTIIAGDFKPQYVCALVFFVVRAIGMGASALTMPAGTSSFLVSNGYVAVVFFIFIAVYLGMAVAMRRGRLSKAIERKSTMVIDLVSVSAVNIWSSHMAPARRLDVGGTDLFWMAAIGGVAVWGALNGRRVGIALLAASGVVVVAMFLANGYSFGSINWAFAISRVVFAAIGLIATTVGLQISELFEDYRRQQGQRAGEEQALGAMHRRALQDLKVITRLARESGPSEGRLRAIEELGNDLTNYVRSWPLQNTPTTLEETIRQAVSEADPTGTVSIRVTTNSNVTFEPEVLRVVGEAVGEATRNVVLHGQTEGASVEVLVDDHYLRIVIADSGCGIEANAAANVDPLTTPNASIGLQRIIDVITGVGGTAELQSTPGEGTIWTLMVSVDQSMVQSAAKP